MRHRPRGAITTRRLCGGGSRFAMAPIPKPIGHRYRSFDRPVGREPQHAMHIVDGEFDGTQPRKLQDSRRDRNDSDGHQARSKEQSNRLAARQTGYECDRNGKKKAAP